MTKITAVLLLLTASLLSACGGEPAALQVNNAWMRPVSVEEMATEESMATEEAMPSMQTGNQTTAAYMEIINETQTTDILIGITADFAERAELHQTIVTDDIAQMRPAADGLPIPAGETAVLQPGGYHIMLTGIERSLEVGDSADITLRFASGETLTITVPVRMEAP